MNSNAVDFPKSLAVKYLHHIEELTAEIKAGMEAVGSNALSSFEQSVSRQQAICTSLGRLTGQMTIEQRMGHDGVLSQPATASDQRLAERILVAAESLQSLNKQYAALLKHCGESIRLFAGLCRSYTGPFQPTAPINAGRGWSCRS